MKLLVTDDHDGEGNFPIFPQGSAVENIMPCDEVPHWFGCTINGMETFIPDIFVVDDKLATEYDPTELVLRQGDVVELQKVVYEWVYVKSMDGRVGWLPASKVVSV